MIQSAIDRLEGSKEHNYGPILYLLKRILELLTSASKGDIKSIKQLPIVIKAAAEEAKELAATVEPKTKIEKTSSNILFRVKIRDESNNTVVWPFADLLYIIGGKRFLNLQLDKIESDGHLDVWYDNDGNRKSSSTKEILIESLIEGSVQNRDLHESAEAELYEFIESFEDPKSYFNRYREDILAVEVIEKGKGDRYLKQVLVKLCQRLAQDPLTPDDVRATAENFANENIEPNTNLADQEIDNRSLELDPNEQLI